MKTFNVIISAYIERSMIIMADLMKQNVKDNSGKLIKAKSFQEHFSY